MSMLITWIWIARLLCLTPDLCFWLQARRVQKCVETLDVLKASNAEAKPVIVTTKWETFDPPATTQWGFFE